MSVAEGNEPNQANGGSSDEPPSPKAGPWREKGVRGDLGNILISIEGLRNIYFPKPSESDIANGLIPTGRTIQLFTVVYLAVIAVAIFWRHLSLTHLAILMMAGGIVIGFECLNTVNEMICDWQQPDEDPDVKRIKDASAGAILAVVCLVVLPVWAFMFINPR